ncbi:EamA family transporter [Acetobacterium wieringae]|uniref:EamA family transporter n=1 Tax=Acetobacterium wieringae TaxID=52694 RepID=UPI002B1F346B|nr:EamA family transporter [Acetobacterium wieringae]MEA4804936.1 EamA family transporter [Acetobacterium wieringae]
MNEFTYYLPILLIVTANVFYNICTKSTPETVNPFLSLLVTYLVAALLTLILMLANGLEEGIVQSVKRLNWTSFALGISVVALEFGYITAYRAGWNISLGSLVANISLAILLIPIGILLYKEVLTTNHLVGITLCLVGLFFINR